MTFSKEAFYLNVLLCPSECHVTHKLFINVPHHSNITSGCWSDVPVNWAVMSTACMSEVNADFLDPNVLSEVFTQYRGLCCYFFILDYKFINSYKFVENQVRKT